MKASNTAVFTAVFVLVGGSYFYLKPAALGPQIESETAQFGTSRSEGFSQSRRIGAEAAQFGTSRSEGFSQSRRISAEAAQFGTSSSEGFSQSRRIGAEAPVPASPRLLALDKDDDVAWLQIQNFAKKETVTLMREGQDWKLKYPVQAPADPLIAKGLVAALKLSAKARVLLPEKGWEEYGLQPPQIKIGIQTDKVRGRRYLCFGNPSPIGDKVFARWESEKEYFLLSRDLLRAFDRTAYSLRWKQIFRLAPEKISRIFVKTQRGEYEMVRRDRAWFWLQPVDLTGDKVPRNFISEIILRLGRLYVKDFLDGEKGPPVKFGIGRASPAIKIWGQGKGYEALLAGKEIPARDSFYGMREGEKDYFFIARDNSLDFFKTVEAAAAGHKPAEA